MADWGIGDLDGFRMGIRGLVEAPRPTSSKFEFWVGVTWRTGGTKGGDCGAR